MNKLKNYIHDLFSPVLSDRVILEYNKKGLLIENELLSTQIQPNSVDLRLGNDYKVIVPNHEFLPSCEVGTKFVEVIDPSKEMKYNSYTGGDDGAFIIDPGQFLLMRSKDVLNIPNGIIAFVQGRSSIARLGIQTEQAGLIDTGFKGTVTFEVFNQNKYPVMLYPGMRIAQIYFFKAQYARRIYGKEIASKYSGQVEATESMIYKDPEWKYPNNRRK